MQFVQAPCYATMDKLSDFNDIFNRRKNVFHLSEFSAESENPIAARRWLALFKLVNDRLSTSFVSLSNNWLNISG